MIIRERERDEVIKKERQTERGSEKERQTERGRERERQRHRKELICREREIHSKRGKRERYAVREEGEGGNGYRQGPLYVKRGAKYMKRERVRE